MYTVESAYNKYASGKPDLDWKAVCDFSVLDIAIDYALNYTNQYVQMRVKDEHGELVAHTVQCDMNYTVNLIDDTHPIDQLIKGYQIDRDVMARLCREWLVKYDEQKGNDNA